MDFLHNSNLLTSIYSNLSTSTSSGKVLLLIVVNCVPRTGAFQQMHINNRQLNADTICHSKQIQFPANLRREIEEEYDCGTETWAACMAPATTTRPSLRHPDHHIVPPLNESASPTSISYTLSDEHTEQAPARVLCYSTLFACGTGSARRKPSPLAVVDSAGGGSLLLVMKVMEEVEESKYMSENPRFGNMQAAEQSSSLAVV